MAAPVSNGANKRWDIHNVRMEWIEGKKGSTRRAIIHYSDYNPVFLPGECHMVILDPVSLLTTQDIGRVFIRARDLMYPSGYQDFNFVPNSSSQIRATYKLLKVSKQGGLVFRETPNREKWMMQFFWNDGHWMDPEHYSQILTDRAAEFVIDQKTAKTVASSPI